MKIKSWMSSLKQSIGRVLDWMFTNGRNDDWWRYEGRFPGDW